MKNYELLYIVSNQYTEEEAKKIQDKVNEMVKSNGGVLGYEESYGRKKLAYPINHIAHGYYFLAEFELEDGTKIKEINENLRLDKEILRAQIIRKDKKTNPEKKARALKEEREEKPEVKKEKIVKEKVITKNLDDKLEEILKTDDLV